MPCMCPLSWHQTPAPPTQWRAQIDTGSTLTMAGGELARSLLHGHLRHHPTLPTPLPTYTADNNLVMAFPIDSVLQVIVRRLVAYDHPSSTPDRWHSMNVPVYATVTRDLKIVGWDDCDMLIGMDVLSRFQVTIVATQRDSTPSKSSDPQGGLLPRWSRTPAGPSLARLGLSPCADAQ